MPCSARSLVAAALLVLAGHGVARDPDRMARAHAHNDYEHARPLLDALEHGYASVEADVWWEDGEVQVSHTRLGSKGALEDLYLRPLEELVRRRGSVHGDGRPFHLWIDIKDSATALQAALRGMLARYSMFRPRGTEGSSPVVAILTGIDSAKRKLVAGPRPATACRDDNRFSEDDPPSDGRWTWYALRWRDHFRWNGRGTMPGEERERLRALVAAVHAKGRRLRLYDTPESEALWAELLAAGVDLVGTDHLARLRGFLEEDAGWLASAR